MNATKKIKNLRLFALFVVPSVFIWMTVVIIPLLYGVAITFTDWNGLSMDIHFIGVKNRCV